MKRENLYNLQLYKLFNMYPYPVFMSDLIRCFAMFFFVFSFF